MTSPLIRSIRRAVLALAAMTISTVAFAGPPYVTDDSAPTDLGKWEIYGFTAGTRFHHATEGEAGFDINYGVAEDFQVTTVIPFEYESHETTRLGDVELGAKYMFIHQQDGTIVPDISFYPSITLPTTGHHQGSGKVGAFFPLFAQKDIGKWSMFGGGGYAINPGEDGKNSWEVGFALTRQVSDKLNIGGEIYHETADEVGGQSLTGLGVGMEYEIADKWALLASGGPIIQNHRANGDFAFYIGLVFAN